ncbi:MULTISPECIES: branched-chain amino acid ABC transporter permease [Halobellus]|uniref:branched-chain amino acid ABC transporter permease n=1 Tax=Halobellus TaxID=1073986 RepID=UPI002114AB0A|nr:MULTISPECIES: branched-chain amino acid ABC transporter permease [Halobellus]MDQ2056104.1 branched-chain amino acid ABC transporter permease [Halobellus sp. H-GB7]
MATKDAAVHLKTPSSVAKIVGLLALVALPLFVSEYQVSTWSTYLTFALLALSIDLVWGYTGLLTLGHAAFFGVGAYVTAKLLKEVPVVPDIAVVFIVAPVVAALLTLALGWFLFSADVKGSYFAITTLIVSIIFESIAGEFVGFLGGFNGIYGIPSIQVVGVELTATMSYYLALGVLVGSYLFLNTLVDSAFGRVLRGIRGNQERTEFFGYDTQQYRLIIFTLSGVMAGVAGSMYATIDGFVSPPLLGFVLSTQVVIWIAVGGRGTLIGAVFGALLIQYLNSTLSDVLINYWEMGLALLFIAVVIGAPRGIVGLLSDIVEGVQATLVSTSRNEIGAGGEVDD